MRIYSKSRFHFTCLAAATLCANAAFGQLTLEFGDPATLQPVASFEFVPNQERTIAVVLSNSGSPFDSRGYNLELEIKGIGTSIPMFLDWEYSTLYSSATESESLSAQFVGVSLTVTAGNDPTTVQAGRSLLGTLTVKAGSPATPLAWALEFGSEAFIIGSTSGTQHFPSLMNSTISVVPEPETYAVAAGLALIGFAAWRRRRMRETAA
jgi:hypothetical protein